MSTGEVADFMLKCVKDDSVCQEYKHILVGISSHGAILTPTRVTFGFIVIAAAAAYYMGYFS